MSVGVAQVEFDWRIEAGQQWYLPEEECSDWALFECGGRVGSQWGRLMGGEEIREQ